MLDIAIYEIHFEKDQYLSDPKFIPHSVENLQPEWREFRHIIDFYRSGSHLKHDLTGLFSRKFGLKLKISGAEFLDFAQCACPVDVVFINPFPQVESIYYNVWEQGETWHPGLMNMANRLLAGSGFDIDVKKIVHQTSAELSFSNFWVGSPEFWELYVGGFLDPIAKFIESGVDENLNNEINQNTYHTSDCGFIPFIVERLFSTFLSFNPQIVRAKVEAVHINDYLIHPFEERAMKIGGKILASKAGDKVIKRNLIRLGQATTSLGKKYFVKNAHPHL